jgi:predicted RNase H-like nuclease (RuvC/YqgF family)
MKLIKDTKIVHKILALTFIVSVLLLAHMVQAENAIPGTEEDPAVAKSYVDAEISKINEHINALNDKINELNAKADSLVLKSEELTSKIEEMTAGEKFEPIEVMAGQKIMLGASAEIVLRSGKATAIAGTYGGLANVAAGVDLQTGDNITPNNLLLISRDDGRGIKAETDIWVIVKGRYTIE